VKIIERVMDAKTGEYFEREIDLPGLMTEAEGIAKDAADAKEAANAAIREQLAANDLKAVRAIVEGDTARIEAHKAAQAELRKQLKDAP
jgi:hypothetical protein